MNQHSETTVDTRGGIKMLALCFVVGLGTSLLTSLLGLDPGRAALGLVASLAVFIVDAVARLNYNVCMMHRCASRGAHCVLHATGEQLAARIEVRKVGADLDPPDGAA